MQIGLNQEEKEAFEYALESGLFDKETITKKLLENAFEKDDVEFVELVDEEDGE